MTEDFSPGGFAATFGGLSRLLDEGPEKKVLIPTFKCLATDQ